MNPEKIVWPASKKIENLDDVMSDDFAEFINRPEYTADQVREAYYQLMGVSERNEADPVVTTILVEMQRLERSGFPVNRFAEFIGTLQRLEDAVPVYEHFVTTLPVTENEKRMLVSIVTQDRSGQLEVMVGGRLAAKVQISKEDDGPELRAGELLHILKRIMARVGAGTALEFTFVE